VVRHQTRGAAARRRLPPAAPDDPQHSGVHRASPPVRDLDPLPAPQETVALITELPLAQLCTDVFDFGHAAEAFRAVDQGKPGLMHAVLNYDRSAAGDL